jgi:hypothetical protein
VILYGFMLRDRIRIFVDIPGHHDIDVRGLFLHDDENARERDEHGLLHKEQVPYRR